jgi:GAF domain-containing protein
MDESFGARLRVQRERQQVALAAIAQQTKISISLLEGLERDDVSHWPEGIFRRAFVRAYAQAIALEPDAVVREFLTLHPDSVEMIPAVFAAAPGADGAPVSRRPPTRLECLMASGIAALPRVLERVQRRGPAATSVTVADFRSPVDSEPAAPEPDLSAVAHLCTRLARISDARDIAPLLEDAARSLAAVGLIIWSWEPGARTLMPSLAHGYPEAVLAQFPRVRRDADNAIAAAFRLQEARIVNGDDGATGAVVVPLMTPSGCTGVLAIEVGHGGEQRESVRALATILAAQLANLVGSTPLAEAVNA